MGLPEIIAIVFGFVGVIGLVYTIHYGRKNQKKKSLIYANSMSIGNKLSTIIDLCQQRRNVGINDWYYLLIP